MTEVTVPQRPPKRPADPVRRMMWETRVISFAVVVALFSVYMRAYYATVAIDVNGLEKRQTYQVWLWELPPLSHAFFAPANWIDDRLRLAPCKNPPVDPVIYKAIARS